MADSQLPGIPYQEYAGNPSTGAPGSSSANGTPNELNPSGAATGDYESGVSASAATGSVGYFPGVGEREDSADLYRPSSFGAANPSSTGAGSGTPNHNHGSH